VSSKPADDARDRYLERVRDHELWFDRKSIQLTQRYQRLLVASVVLAGSTPLLVLVSELPKVVQALPAALASMLSGISAIYSFPDRIAAYGRARDAIESQRVRFENRLPPYDDDESFGTFAERIEQAISSGVAEGRAAWLRGASQFRQPSDATNAATR
jgi:hypothetical protein